MFEISPEVLEVIGYCAAVITTIATTPQVYKVWKTQHTKDLSFAYFLMLTLGVFLWLIYGISLQNMPMITANTLTVCFVGYILFVKIKNMVRHKSERKFI